MIYFHNIYDNQNHMNDYNLDHLVQGYMESIGSSSFGFRRLTGAPDSLRTLLSSRSPSYGTHIMFQTLWQNYRILLLGLQMGQQHLGYCSFHWHPSSKPNQSVMMDFPAITVPNKPCQDLKKISLKPWVVYSAGIATSMTSIKYSTAVLYLKSQ